MNRFIIIALLFTALLFPSAAFPRQSDITAEIVCEDFPPYFSPTLPSDGMVGEILREAFRGSGVTVRFVYVPYARALVYFREGRYPMHSATSAVFTPDEKRRSIITHSFLNVRWCLFTYNRPPISFRKISDLRRYRIGTYIGSIDNSIFREAGIVPEEKSSLDSLIKMLHYERLDAVSICDIAFYPKASQLYPAEKEKFSASKPVIQVDGSVMFSRKHPDGERLSRIFGAGLAELKRSGKLRQIVERYYGKGRMPDGILL